MGGDGDGFPPPRTYRPLLLGPIPEA